jgi:hypothetical protein
MIRSFIRSLLKWQEAMIAATAHPHPVALPPAPFNVEEAELDLGAAEAWVAHIDELAHQIALNIEEAEARGGGRHPAIKKWRKVLRSLEDAYTYAAEYADTFRKGPRRPDA